MAVSPVVSSYVACLDSIATLRYTEKLSCVGLSLVDDPYLTSNDEKYVNDMTTWPSIEYGNIFGYFIPKPGVYTQEQLLSWKQMDAFNYFQSGYVRTVFSYQFGPQKKMVILKAKVNPSQKSPDSNQEAWLIVKKDGEVLSAHCTCMAGLGEGCSHVAAIMFKVECAVRLGHTSVTSQACKWNEVFCKKIEPSLIVDISFTRPKNGEDVIHSTSAKISSGPSNASFTSELMQKIFLTKMKEVMPSAVIHTPINNSTVSSIQPARRVVRKLPLPLTSLQNSKYAVMTKDELELACRDVFNGLKISFDEAEYLEESTRLQSQSLLWYEHRAGRITASVFRKVARASIDNPPESLISKLMQKSRLNSMAVPALCWGLVKEDEARAAYVDIAEKQHGNLQLLNSGLHVNPTFPHLGASPDGVVSCDCCGIGLVEIKCPFKYKDRHPHNICDSQFYLKHTKDGEINLSQDHEYYFQIQGQMAVCNMEYCDFVCWTPLGFHCERIDFDSSQFFGKVKPLLDSFFLRVLLPRLLIGYSSNERCGTKRSSSSQERTYCFCGGKDEGKMIACDNISCEIDWFHFQCVGLTRKPRGKWFCSEKCRTCDMQSNV